MASPTQDLAYQLLSVPQQARAADRNSGDSGLLAAVPSPQTAVEAVDPLAEAVANLAGHPHYGVRGLRARQLKAVIARNRLRMIRLEPRDLEAVAADVSAWRRPAAMAGRATKNDNARRYLAFPVG